MSQPISFLNYPQHIDNSISSHHPQPYFNNVNNTNTSTIINSDITVPDENDKTSTCSQKHQCDDIDIDIEIASFSSDSLFREITDEVDGPSYGWVNIFVCFIYQMISMGLCSSIGIFGNYYLTETFKDKASIFQITWIGTLAMTLLDGLGPFTGSFCDYFGHRITTLIGTSIMTLSLVLAAFSTQVWHLYLTQGVLYGAGTSLTYFASMTLPSKWFTKNRGLVTGIAISGGGIGGLWISPVISYLLTNKGQRFTLLVIAAAHLVFLFPSGLLYRTRRETGRERVLRIEQENSVTNGCIEKEEKEMKEKTTKFVDFEILKDLRFCLLVVSCAFVICGYLSPFFFITSYATQHGVDGPTAALMVGLMNGFSALGRIVMGFVLDRIGSINALCISTLAASMTILFLWSFANTATMMLAFSIAFGFCGGAHVSSAISATSAIAGLDRIGSVTGIMYAVMTVGSTIGLPVSGAILDTIGHGTDYMGVILWSGSVILIASGIQLWLRFITSREVFVKV